MCRVNNKGKECESKERKLKAADRYGGPKCSSYKMARGLLQVKGRNGEWMEGMSLLLRSQN